jgi:hypothetical protein
MGCSEIDFPPEVVTRIAVQLGIGLFVEIEREWPN